MNRTLRTARLTLRPVEAADLETLHAHWIDADVRRFLFDGATLPPSEVATVIAASEAGFASSGHALWIIGRDGDVAGAVGLRPLDDLGPEIYYSLVPDAWGHGYAVEAARVVVGHAFEVLGVTELFAEVDAGNTASVAVTAKLGMTYFDTVPGALGPLARYVLRP